ncbi:hypothetical protein ACE6H2_015650 [Prunus campanulata]
MELRHWLLQHHSTSGAQFFQGNLFLHLDRSHHAGMQLGLNQLKWFRMTI